MSPSAKLAVTCIGPTSSWIAYPDGARMPGTTPTAETMPSAGAVSVAAATWMVAWRTDSWSDAIVDAVAAAVRLVYEPWADLSERFADATWSDAELVDALFWRLSDASWSWAEVTAFRSAVMALVGELAAGLAA